jgi:hypothetical protein
VNANNPTAQARALKFQAEILEFGNGAQPNVNAATQLLNNAIQILPAPRAGGELLDAAELHEMQGRVRSKRLNWDWDGAALNSYTTAEGLYLQISGPEAAAALARIAEERRKILTRRTPQPNGSADSTTSAAN